MGYITPNGAGFRPEVEDVWSVDVPVDSKSKFVNHFIAYAQSKAASQEVSEDDYFDQVWAEADFSKL